MVPLSDVLEIVNALIAHSESMVVQLQESYELTRKVQAIADGALAHGTRLTGVCEAYVGAFDSVAHAWDRA